MFSKVTRFSRPQKLISILLLPLFLCVMSDDLEAQWSTAEKTDEFFVDNARFESKCSHIEFLTNTQANRERVPSDLKDRLITPGKYQRKLMILALNEVDEFVCKSVGKIAFYADPKTDKETGSNKADPDPEKWASIKGSHPDLINIYTNAAAFSEEQIMPTSRRSLLLNEHFFRLEVSYSQWPDLMKTIIHEAAHCAMYLLQSQTSKGGQRPWPEAIQSRAKEIVEKAGLESGFEEEWARIHRDFRGLFGTTDYDKSTVGDLRLAPANGFFTHYARRNPWEDVADTFALLTVNGSTVKTGDYADELVWAGVQMKSGSDPIPNELDDAEKSSLLPAYVKDWHDPCLILRNVKVVGVPSALAAVYTKIMFLIDVKFIDEETYRRCAGDGGEPNLRFSYNRTDNGFHRVDYDSGDYLYSHGEITVGFPKSPSEPQTFLVQGKGILNADDGKSYDTEMRLEVHTVKKPNLPRGIYSIPENISTCPESPLNRSIFRRPAPWTFDLWVPDAPSKSFCVTGGYLLVTRATRDFIEASMLAHTILKHVIVDVAERPNFKVHIRWERK